MDGGVEKALAHAADEAAHDPDAAQRAFELVMLSISSEPAMAPFKGEYAKLLAALKASFGAEKKLVSKVRALNEEIASNASRVQQALRLSEEDGATIDELRKQLERAWGLVEAGNTRAEAMSQNLERVGAEAAAHGATLARYAALLGDGATLEEVVAAKESLEARLAAAATAVGAERARADGLLAELAARTKKYREKKDEVAALHAVVVGKDEDLAKAARQRSALQGDLASAKDAAADKAAAADAAKRAADAAEAARAKAAAAAETERARTTAALAELSAAKNAGKKASDDLAVLLEKAAVAAEAKAALDKALHAAQAEAAREAAARAKAVAKAEALSKEVASVRAVADRHAEALAALRTELVGVEKDVLAERAAVKEKDTALGRVERDKAAAEKKAADAASRTGAAQLEISAKGSEIAALENALKAAGADLRRARAACASYELERTKARADAEALQRELAERDTALEIKNVQLADMEKREAELGARLKAAQTAFESSRAERNAALKSLAGRADEMDELRRKFKILSNQLESSKDDVLAKDKLLIAEQFEVAALAKRLDQRTAEVDTTRRLLHDASDNVGRQGAELGNAAAALRRADADAVAQKRAFDALVAERDLLAAQLTRRNDEMALLHEKNALAGITLAKGETQFKALAEENHVCKLKVRGARRDVRVRARARAPRASSPPYPRPLHPAARPADCRAQARHAARAGAQHGRGRGDEEAHCGDVARPQRGAREGEGARRGAGPAGAGAEPPQPPPPPPLFPPQNKLLTTELENPLNVHRWRKLEGTDPELHDLIARFATLQKRLIAKTEEVVERDLAIAERDRVVAELRARVAAAPGAELGEQLAAAQHALAERSRQLKSAASEATMFQTQAAAAAYEVERISRELADAKRAAFAADAKKRAAAPGAAGKRDAHAPPPLEVAAAPMRPR
jgi:chromosome segregation ATPase